MPVNKLLLQDGSSLLLQDGSHLLLQSSEELNTSSMWRGAVEPAETGASGNEIQLWRGAVEPLYVPEVLQNIQIGVDRKGGYGVEQEIRGQRPEQTESGAIWGRGLRIDRG